MSGGLKAKGSFGQPSGNSVFELKGRHYVFSGEHGDIAGPFERENEAVTWLRDWLGAPMGGAFAYVSLGNLVPSEKQRSWLEGAELEVDGDSGD